MLWNTSYTTGHKAFRARATVELGRAIGWDRARHVIYAGVPDLAVGPHWHSAYEMACQVAMYELEDEPPASRKEPTRQSRRDAELFANAAPLTAPETESLIEAITKAPEPAYIEQITRLLKAGRAPQRILDAIQIAAARVILETAQPDNFSMPQHGYEYTNTLRWVLRDVRAPTSGEAAVRLPVPSSTSARIGRGTCPATAARSSPSRTAPMRCHGTRSCIG